MPDRADRGHGETSKDIAARLRCNASTVGKWGGRFARHGLDGLHDESRPGQPRKITDSDVERVIVKRSRSSRSTHALVHTLDGGGDGVEPNGDQSDLASLRAQAPSDRELQAVRDLVASIRTWIKGWNDDPKPYVWHKTSDDILDSLAAYCQRINDSGH